METKTEDAPETPAPKAKSRASAKSQAKAAAKAQATSDSETRFAAKQRVAAGDKAAEKAKKEQEKVDMKARVKCPVCHRTVSQHCLLYTHVCSKAALDSKPKTATVEEKFEKPEEPVVESVEPPKRVRIARPKDVPSVPKTLPDDSEEDVPPPPRSPPPLLRQSAAPARERPTPPLAPYPPQLSYREQLILRQRERQHHAALAQVAPIRRLFRR